GSGWSLSLGSFTVIEEPCRGREVRSHFRHILPWPSARLTRAVGLSCWPATLAASRSRRSLLVLHAPRRSAVKPGTTPVELAAPRVRRVRSSRRLDNQSNATPRSWCGSRRRARDGCAHSPSVAGLDDSSHRLLLKRSVAAALPAGPFASGIMRRAPNFWPNLLRPIQGPKASILWARPHVSRQPSWSQSAKTEVL